MRKERERDHLMHFREVCSFFPEGEIEAIERPDFVVHTPKGLLGIEHTEMLQPGNPHHGGYIQAQENLRQRVVDRAKDLYARSSGPPLRVEVLFHPGFDIRKQSVDDLSKSLANLVSCTPPVVEGSVTLGPSWETWDTFPREIARVKIFYGCKDSGWYPLSVGFIPRIGPDEIQGRIRAKEPISYKARYLETWLLIVEDGFRMSSTVEVTRSAMEYCYTTEFDRVFYFWNFDGKFHEFNLAKRS